MNTTVNERTLMINGGVFIESPKEPSWHVYQNRPRKNTQVKGENANDHIVIGAWLVRDWPHWWRSWRRLYYQSYIWSCDFPNTSSLPRKLVRYCRFRVPSKKIVTHLRIGVDSSTERILYKGRLQTVCRHLLLPLLTEKYSGTQGDFKGFGRKLLTYKYNV